MKPASSEPPASYTLRVEGDAAAELFVIDSSFGLVQRGVARLEASLPAGVYKVKSRRAREEAEQIILLDGDQSVRLVPSAFASPAPFQGTTLTHETHIAAAARESGNVHVTAGIGSRIFLLSRYWTSTSPSRVDRVNPAHGLSLRRLTGQTVADFGEGAVLGDIGGDAWAACTVAVDPGTYLLHQEIAEGLAVERSVVTSPDWQTQVFFLKNVPRTGSEPTADAASHDAARALLPDAASVFMSRGGFDPERQDMELAEVARIALADERRILSDQLMPMLAGKFDNPMLGIFGAHILLLTLDRAAAEAQAAKAPATAGTPGRPELELTLDAHDLDAIVRNLRSLVGDAHPDVEALSLRAIDPSLRHTKPLRQPPMLRRSWSLFIAASNDAPSLLPPDLWTRVRQMTPSPPYFTWLRGRSGTDPAHDLVKSVSTPAGAAARSEARATLMAAGQPHRPAFRGRAGGGGGVGFAADEGPLLAAAEPPDEVGSFKDVVAPRAARRRRFDPELRMQMSLENDIPRSVLDRAFRAR